MAGSGWFPRPQRGAPEPRRPAGSAVLELQSGKRIRGHRCAPARLIVHQLHARDDLDLDVTIRRAYEHLLAQERACIAVMDRMGVQIAENEAPWNPVPLAVRWAGVSRGMVQFFEHAGAAGGSRVKYTFAPYTGQRYTYSDHQRPQEGPPNAWSQQLVFVFDAARSTMQPQDILDVKAQEAVRQHVAVRNFFRRLASIEDLAAVTRHIRNDQPVFGGRNVDAQTYYRLCIVVALSAVETLLHDLFFAYQPQWFSHLGAQHRKAAMQTSVLTLDRKNGTKSWALVEKAGSVELAFIEFLRPSGRSRISFQDLHSKRRGAKWAYRHFFGIHLPQILERAEKDAWRKLLRVQDQRHAEIHPGTSDVLDRFEVDSALAAIRAGQCALLAEIMNRETLAPETSL